MVDEKAGNGVSEAAAPLYLGHRERARKRFLQAGGEALADYELLELVLHLVIPRVDTKETAKLLLKKFGSFSAVFGAPTERLMEIPGIKDAAAANLKIIQAAAQRFGNDRIVKDMPILNAWPQLIEYCRRAMAFESREQFRILFLDKKNKLIADEVQQTGTVDHAPVYPREVIRRALELSAMGVILVHNHPSGDPTPSSADVQMTRHIKDIAKPLGISVHDHIIIGKSGHSSMREMKLL